MHHHFRKLEKLRHAMGSHRHGRRGFGGPFAGGFADGTGMGGGGFRTGRKLGAADLQIVILALLKDKPRHGYEVIKAIEEHSGGFYVPSPGVIYPALTYLEEVGEAVVEVEGNKKLYSVTPDGEARLKKDQEIADAIMVQLGRMGQKMDRVREAFAADEEDATGTIDVRTAVHGLRMALRSKKSASNEERQRVLEILQRATKEILGS
jgi:DNA-binding PadR family transcriptional regulator